MANVSNPESRGYSSAEAHISRVETHKSLIVDALTKLDVRSEAEKRADWVVNAALIPSAASLMKSAAKTTVRPSK